MNNIIKNTGEKKEGKGSIEKKGKNVDVKTIKKGWNLVKKVIDIVLEELENDKKDSKK